MGKGREESGASRVGAGDVIKGKASGQRQISQASGWGAAAGTSAEEEAGRRARRPCLCLHGAIFCRGVAQQAKLGGQATTQKLGRGRRLGFSVVQPCWAPCQLCLSGRCPECRECKVRRRVCCEKVYLCYWYNVKGCHNHSPCELKVTSQCLSVMLIKIPFDAMYLRGPTHAKAL